MVLTTRRWLTTVTRATWAAPEKIAAIAGALLPSSGTGPGQSSATLPGASEKAAAHRGERGAHVGDGVELLVLDHDLFGGVLRLRDALGDHQRDRLAGMQHALARERRAERHDQLAAVAAAERRMQRGRADAGRVQLLVGQQRDDAGRISRRPGVDRPDARMRCGERTNTACAWFSCGASSTNRPSPAAARRPRRAARNGGRVASS